MKYIFDKEKSLKLKHERGISFEEIIEAIEEKKVTEVYKHFNTEKYPTQKVLYVEINDYMWVVPFLKDGDSRILKTAYPSRKVNTKYLKMQSGE